MLQLKRALVRRGLINETIELRLWQHPPGSFAAEAAE